MVRQSELNAHPMVLPALRAWRAARAARDRVLLDGRCSDETRRHATRAAEDARTAYDRAADAVLRASGPTPKWLADAHRAVVTLNEQSRQVEVAAETLARIVADPTRGEKRDGAVWESAVATLRAHGISGLPRSQDLSWED